MTANGITLFAAWLVSVSVTVPIIDGTRSRGVASAFVLNGSSLMASQRRALGNTQPTPACTPSSLVLFALEPSDTIGDPASPSSATNSNNSNDGDFSFFDEASIYIRAGSGGQGSSTWKKAKKGSNGIPDGGSGGVGGNVFLKLDPSLNTLAGLSRRALRPNAFGGGGAAASSKRMGHTHQKQGGKSAGNDEDGDGDGTTANNFVVRERLLSFRANDGTAGGRMYDKGRGGEDCEVLVPPGTVVKLEVPRRKDLADDNDDVDCASDEIAIASGNVSSTVLEVRENEEQDEEYDLVELGTVSYENPTLEVARGGKGGEGTATLKGKKKGATRSGPVGGERGRLRLTLKIVADIALVGVPNAGKSTFLAAVTRAKPRIADYPFTTVVPNLGTWVPTPPEKTEDNHHYSSYNQDRRSEKKNKTINKAAGANGLVLCDVPGLIAGASEGVGLGHAFLRHIERCRVILHLVDATSDDPVGDLAMVNDELKRYGSGSLANKPQVVIVNKIDAAFGESQFGDDEEQAILDDKKADLATKMKEEMGHTRLIWVSAKEKDGVDDLMTRMASYVGNMKEEEEQKEQKQSEEDATPVV